MRKHAAETCYDFHDKDQDGDMSLSELASAFVTLSQHPTQEELQDLIDQYDVDGSGLGCTLRLTAGLTAEFLQRCILYCNWCCN